MGKLDRLKKGHNSGTIAKVAGRSAANIKAELDGLAGVQTVALDKVRIDGGTQIRVGLNNDTVNEYAEAMNAGDKFPALDCMFDGSDYWLSDGFHRYHALRQTNATLAEINVNTGTKRDAMLAAIGANSKHGLQRSNEDKRRAVETLLADSEWSQWSNVRLAEQAGVTDKTIAKYREELTTSEIPMLRKGADGKLRKAPVKTGGEQQKNRVEHSVRDALKSIIKATKNADPQAVASLTKGKDIEAAKAAYEWLGSYIKAIESNGSDASEQIGVIIRALNE